VVAIVRILHVRALALNRVNRGGATGRRRSNRPIEWKDVSTRAAAALAAQRTSPHFLARARFVCCLPKVDSRIEIDNFICGAEERAAAAADQRPTISQRRICCIRIHDATHIARKWRHAMTPQDLSAAGAAAFHW
jgi:hypothetical protein